MTIFRTIRFAIAKALVPEDRNLKALISLSRRAREAERHAEYHEKEAAHYRLELERIHDATNPYMASQRFQGSHP